MAPNIRHIRIRDTDRVETGTVQFNEDWPGLFIRGDECHNFLRSVRQASLSELDPLNQMILNRLADYLDDVAVKPEPQGPFDQDNM